LARTGGAKLLSVEPGRIPLVAHPDACRVEFVSVVRVARQQEIRTLAVLPRLAEFTLYGNESSLVKPTACTRELSSVTR
jgi:hypothetical protein